MYVVSDRVPFGYHAFDEIGILLAVIVCHEEYGTDAFFLQRVEYFRGVAVFVPLVKCEPKALFLAAANEQRSVFAVLLLCRYRTEGAVLFININAHSVGDLRVVIFVKAGIL